MSKEDYLLVQRGFIHYLQSDAGKQTMMTILGSSSKTDLLKAVGISLQPATYEKTYYPYGYYGIETHKLESKNLAKFEGYVYYNPHTKDQSIHKLDDIEVREVADLVECEGCHARLPKTYCVTQTKTVSGGREHIEILCNNCKLHSSDYRLRSEASGKTCTECKFTDCAYHPGKAQKIPSSFMAKLEAERKDVKALGYQAPVQNFEVVNFSEI